jgi:hypothetical protein
MHGNKPFMTNDTAQGLLVNVMGRQQETLIGMALDMALDMAPDTVMITGTTIGVTVVDVTTEEVLYLS